MEFAIFFSVLFLSFQVYGCVYKYADEIRSGHEFILDKATYKCAKTNELTPTGGEHE